MSINWSNLNRGCIPTPDPCNFAVKENFDVNLNIILELSTNKYP
jgi:hypothetical protein